MPEFADKCEFYDVVAIKDTGKALWVQMSEEDGGEKLCIPHSQIDDDSEVYEEGTDGTLVVSRWIAEQKGLL